MTASSPPTWDQRLAGQFIMSLAYDRRGCVWAGTEGQGVWRYDPFSADQSKAWSQFTTRDGLGDDNGYAIACDQQGRVWVGTLNHGVSVFNGNTWKNYDQVSGPLGGHVIAIAVSPKSGDVWMASEVGLARYCPNNGDWKYYVAPPGVSLSNASGLTFDSAGNILVATQADGIVIGDASSRFERWAHMTGPERFSAEPSGSGLPSRQINCVLATQDGRIWAGTYDGLAVSSAGGVDWRYVRGADYESKNIGLYTNKDFCPSLCGFQLTVADASGNAVNNGQYIAVVASQPAQDQLGVHIACSGGSVHGAAHDIDLSHAKAPGPVFIYKSERQGEFAYTLTGVVPNRPLDLRMDFAELECNGPGQRKFSVFVNDVVALKDFDIYAEARGQFTALVKHVTVAADATGKLTIRLTGRSGAPSLPAKGKEALAAGQLMAEDYVSCLAEGDGGKIYVGHWRKGTETFDPASNTFSPFAAKTDSPEVDAKGQLLDPGDFISGLLAVPGGSVLVGTYGGGLYIDGPTDENAGLFVAPAKQPVVAISNNAGVPFPSAAKAPTSEELTELDAAVTSPSLADLKPGEGAYVGVDWSTRGDWVGRYGGRYAMLCSADSPLDHEISNDRSYTVGGDIGPDRRPGDGVRRWIQWLRTDDPRVLYDPVIGSRREAEWDDHGEGYPFTQEGPDVWATVSVPAGVHRLSAYFVNKDGHVGANRQRDYLVALLPWRADMRDSLELKSYGPARIRQFWGGAHQVFVVCGPAKYYLHVSRNNSFNTTLCSIMLDKLIGPPTEYEIKYPGLHSVYLLTKRYDAYLAPPDAARASAVDPKGTDAARKLWSDLDAAAGKRLLAPAIGADRVFCYRAAAAVPGCDPALLAWWRRSLPMVTDDDRVEFVKAMSDIYKDEVRLVPGLNNPHL